LKLDFKRYYVVIAIAIFIGVFLRFYKIDYQSVWIDEIFSLNQSNPTNSLSGIYSHLRAYDPHPPLYYFSLHFFFKFFGYSTFVMKTFSAIFGVVGLFGIYLLGKEMANKRVGLIALTLTVFNYFHIYYSQEARMYSMLFTTTIFAFYFLVKFIKQPSNKSFALYVVFSSLMIYTHFFGLFTLISQYIILLYFIVKPFYIERKKFIIYTLSSGILTIVIYIPALLILFQNTKRESTWIPKPSVELFKNIYKEFFGFSDILTYTTIFFIVMFFIKLFKNGRQSKENKFFDLNENVKFISLVLFTWIIVSVSIPLFLSLKFLPIIVSRYFINILPAIILIMSIGIDYIKIKSLKLSILIAFCLTSVINLVYSKKYYEIVTKTQFREAAEAVINNNPENHTVYSSLGSYFTFFMNDSNHNTSIVEKELHDHISEMIKDSSKIESFWYVNAHGNPFKVNGREMEFLKDNFYIDNYNFFDAWAKHYKVKTGSSLDIKKVYENNCKVKYWIEKVDQSKDDLVINGWGYLENIDATNTEIITVLLKGNEILELDTDMIIRPDITETVNHDLNLDNSGFNTNVELEKISKGKYEIGIIFKNTTLNKYALIRTGKSIDM